MSKLLKALNIYNFDQLYFFSKLRLIKCIKYNQLASSILENLIKERETVHIKSVSIKADFILLEKFVNSKMENIVRTPLSILLEAIKLHRGEDGICNSIKTCLFEYEKPLYRYMLRMIIKTPSDARGITND
jgi:hypothetical protein